MTLMFPNRSRSFDEARKAIRFLGYDGMFQVPFLVEVAALAKKTGSPKTTEADCLAAFDAARASILEIAQKVYSHGRRTNYVLTAADFR